MDFEGRYGPEIEAFRQEVGQWLDAHLPPDGRWFLATAVVNPEQEWSREFQREFADRGWAAPSWPREYGGGGLTATHDVVTKEEWTARKISPLYETNHQVAAAILAWGSEQQRRCFIRPLLRGDVTVWKPWAHAVTVVDPGVVNPQAVKDGDDYIVSGEEVFIGDSSRPTYLWVLTVTDPKAPPHRQLNAFFIPADLPGVTITGQPSKAQSERRSIVLEDARVPIEFRIGAEGEGWAVAQSCSDIEAEANKALQEQQVLVGKLLQHCRKAFSSGKPGSQGGEAREHVVEAYIDAQVLRLIVLRNRWMRSTSQEMSFHEPQYALLARQSGPKLESVLENVLGPYTTLDDREWAPLNGEIRALQEANSSSDLRASIGVEEYLMSSYLGLCPHEYASPQDALDTTRRRG